MYPEANHKNKIIYAAILLLAIIIIGFGVLKFVNNKNSTNNGSNTATSTRANVKVIQGLTTSDGVKNVPEGIPELPIEGPLVESYKAVYSTQNITQYTVTYISTKPVSDLMTEYNDFLIANGYSVEKTSNTIIANKSGDTLSIGLSTRNKASYIQLNYLDRP